MRSDMKYRGARRGDWCVIHFGRRSWRLAKVSGTHRKIVTKYRWRGTDVERKPDQVVKIIPKGTEEKARDLLGTALKEQVLDLPEPKNKAARCTHLQSHWTLDGDDSVLVCKNCGIVRDRASRIKVPELWDKLRKRGESAGSGAYRFLAAMQEEEWS